MTWVEVSYTYAVPKEEHVGLLLHLTQELQAREGEVLDIKFKPHGGESPDPPSRHLRVVQ